MADTVKTVVHHDSSMRYIATFINTSDGTGESAVAKVDKSAIKAAVDLAEAAALEIERIVWNCQGMEVNILFDHSTDDLVFKCIGSGSIDFTSGPYGHGPIMGIRDPGSAGDTGDILFTTVNHSSGDTYCITLWCKKHQD